MAAITVIGDGGWGTALAMVLHGNGHRVTVWGPSKDYIAEIESRHENRKFLPGVPLPADIRWTADRRRAAADIDGAVIAVPSRYYLEVVDSFRGAVGGSTPLLSVTKGLDNRTLRRMSEVAAEEFNRNAISVLSGPSHAEEVARRIPAAVTVAGPAGKETRAWQEWFASTAFRVYTGDDPVGVELGGALKNVIALAAGISDGLGYGDNTKAALMTRGLAEIIRLGVAAGARAETFAGLSGVGDLIATCTSRHSRNRRTGEQLGRGKKLPEVIAATEQVAEGVDTCGAALRLAERHGINTPIIRKVHEILFNDKPPQEAVQQLLARSPKPEQQSAEEN